MCARKTLVEDNVQQNSGLRCEVVHEDSSLGGSPGDLLVRSQYALHPSAHSHIPSPGTQLCLYLGAHIPRSPAQLNNVLPFTEYSSPSLIGRLSEIYIELSYLVLIGKTGFGERHIHPIAASLLKNSQSFF